MQTSTDNILWQKDAKYLYYHHGPLARTEIGANLVQGVDYVYTLQGWIKGVNSNSLSSQTDPGMDNLGMNTANPSLNQNFAKDVYGYTLGYFDGDYQPIDMIKWNTTNRFEADKTASQLVANRNNLYNGNIGSMVTTIVDPNNPGVPLPLGSAYNYDQLNRIILGTSYTNLNLTSNTWSSGAGASNLYRNDFVYDANGNILNQKRYNNAGVMFDNLDYRYDYSAFAQPNGANGGTDMRRNRLYHVNDQIASVALETDDIDDMGNINISTSGFTWGNSTNYDYTAIGELKKDVKGGISNIEWTVYGKIKQVTQTNSQGKLRTLKFDYDASGNRIAKHVFKASNVWEKSTYYSRDAQGNVMSVYEQFFNPTIAAGSYAQVEKHIYGSSRLGMEKTFVELIDNNGPGPDPNNLSTARLMIIDAPGERVYELTNHLGNVLATVTDRKIPVGDMNDNIIGYNAELYTANDYSAFGAPLKGRKFDKTYCMPNPNYEAPTPVVTGTATIASATWQGSGGTHYNAPNGNLVMQENNQYWTQLDKQKDFPLQNGKTYILTFNVASVSGPVVANITNWGNVNQTQNITAPGTYTYQFTITNNTTLRLRFSGNAPGIQVSLSDLSIVKPAMDDVLVLEENYNNNTQSGWTISQGSVSVSNGELVLSKTNNSLWWNSLNGQKNFTYTGGGGVQYTFEFDVTATSGTLNVWTNIGYSAAITTPGHYTYTFNSWGNTLTFGFNAGSAATGQFKLDNFKITKKDAVVSTQTETTCVNFNTYRYSFNNQEHDDEIAGDGNSMTAEFWQYDARLGRRWNLDPEDHVFASNYSCFANNPIHNIDVDGDVVKPADFRTFMKLAKAYLTNSEARNVLNKQMFAKRHYIRHLDDGTKREYTKRAVFTYKYNSSIKAESTELNKALATNQENFEKDESNNLPTSQMGPSEDKGKGGGYYALFFEWKTIKINKIGTGTDGNDSKKGHDPREFSSKFKFGIIQSINISGAANEDFGNEIVSFKWHNNIGGVTLPSSSALNPDIGINSANALFSNFDGAKGRQVRSGVNFLINNPNTKKGGPNAFGAKITIIGR